MNIYLSHCILIYIRISISISISCKKVKHVLFLIYFGKRLEDKLPVKENTSKKRKIEERKKERQKEKKYG